MNPVELYKGETPAPVYSELGDNLIKVYFNRESAKVTVPLMDDSGNAKTVTEHTAWHVDVEPEYRKIISGIVRSKYSQDDVEAIICNHTEGRGDADEYNAFVAWREEARKVATNVMKELAKVVK
jgi:hypothetical protein